MLTVDRKKIVLLHPVRIDRNLLKHSHRTIDDKSLNDNLNELFISQGELFIKDKSINTWDGVPFSIQRTFRTQWKKNLAELYIKTRLLLHNSFTSKKIKEEEFFILIKNSFKELETYSEEDNNIIKRELESLYESKQKFLFTKLKNELTVKECEIIIKSGGFIQYQEEEDIVSFVLKSEAGLSLVELEYFEYEIPKEVQEKLIKADELRVFDNFYILHKDQNFKPEKINHTKVEKDPILFGVLNGSTKLYYIADWITDYCDLTYDVLLKAGNNNRKL